MLRYRNRNITICSRCVYDETVPDITFDQDGVCNYCHLHDSLELQYPTGAEGAAKLDALLADIKRSGEGKKFDCVVGVSGGCDSSYLLHQMVEHGLRPLAVHFDNTWNSPIATQNIYKVLGKLGVELYTHVVDNKEFDDIYRSFLLAGLKDAEGVTDIGLASTMYMAAEKYGIKYIVEGHSFRTEGISPLGWLYMDGKLTASVHRQFGRLPMKTFPNMTLQRFLRWTTVRSIRRVRPLYYMDYDKDAARQMLSERYGWQWYGGHHLENRLTAFYHSYYLPQRFQSDYRLLGHAALVRSKQLTRDEALKMLDEPPEIADEILALVKKRFGFTEEQFEQVMEAPQHTWREYPTYKPTFERLRPLFYLLTKAGRVPESFYIKFCFPMAMGQTTHAKAARS